MGTEADQRPVPTGPMNARIRLLLLALGATAGLIMAATGLIDGVALSPDELPAHAVARVDERYIPWRLYAQLLNDLSADRRATLDARDRKFVLDRMIDEELLIMRGIELGLAESSPHIRKSLAAAVIAQVAAEAEAATPDESSLRRLYETDSAFFATAARYRLRWWRLSDPSPGTAQRVQTAYRQLDVNSPIEDFIASAGLEPESMLPDHWLPLNKLIDYLGPELAQVAAGLEPGEYSVPVAAGADFHILHLLGREEGVVPPFEQVRPVVEAEYIRRAGDEALRRYLAWLRERAEIVVAPLDGT